MNYKPETFRPVPRTGVIYVMHEAAVRGYNPQDPEWINLGQGSPETGMLPGSAERVQHIDLSTVEHKYAPVGGLPELREAIAELYNKRYRRGMPSQYTAENVCIGAGGRLALTRIATALGSINLGHILPDYTAYEELLEVFRLFVPIPIIASRYNNFTITPDTIRSEIMGKGLGALLLSNPCNPTGHVIQGGSMRAWIDICRKLMCTLIIDEFYSHFTYSNRHELTSSAARYVEDVNKDPIVIVDGLTKNWRYPGCGAHATVHLGGAAYLTPIRHKGSLCMFDQRIAIGLPSLAGC